MEKSTRYLLLLALAFSGCTTVKVNDPARALAQDSACDSFNKLAGEAKQTVLFQKHLKSAVGILKELPSDGGASLSDGGMPTATYVDEFIGGTIHRLHYAEKALVATGKFLSPHIDNHSGYVRLKPT